LEKRAVTGRNKIERKSRKGEKNERKVKKEGKIDRDIMVTSLVGCIGVGAAVGTLALFGCVVEVAGWAGVTFQ